MADDQDVWERFKPIFTQLYAVEKKTLKDVKATMENHHGFPETPLSTYEAKLRDKLHLRKNLKAGEWATIYSFVRTRRLTEFDCYFHGVLLPRTRVSKELRRYRPRAVAQPSNLSIALPPGIEVRERRAPDPLPSPRLPIRETSTQLEIEMPDAADENASIVPYSPPRLSPVSQRSEFPLEFRWCSPVNDLNNWGAPSARGMQSALSRSSTPTDWWMNEFVNLSPSGSLATPRVTAAEETVVSELGEPPAPHTSVIQRSTRHTASSSRDQHLCARPYLENLPWVQYRPSLQIMHNNRNQSGVDPREIDGWPFAVMLVDGVFEHSHPGLPVQITNASVPAASEMFEPTLPSGTLSVNFDPFHFLGGIVYLFSNNLHGELDNGFVRQLFDNLTRVSRDLVLNIFKSNQPSIRAVWENIFHIASKHQVRTGLQLLITIGLQVQPLWIDDRREDVLFAAATVGDASLLNQILDTRWGSRYPTSHVSPACIGAAARCGAVDCARLLLEKCDPNATVLRYGCLGSECVSALGMRCESGGIECVSIFIAFLYEFGTALITRHLDFEVHAGESLPAYIEILHLFIRAGADLDMAFSPKAFGAVQLGWNATCLDICFYLAGPLPEIPLNSSRLWHSEITRAGICNALLQGQSGLAEYLESRPAPPNMKISQCLQVVVVEQFQFSGSDFSSFPSILKATSPGNIHRTHALRHGGFGRVQALLEYGISIRAWGGWRPAICLNMVLWAAVDDGMQGDLPYLLSQAMESGADILPTTYDHCIKEGGKSALATLISLDADFQANGSVPLLKAAQESNFEAVLMLLRKGVDINSEIGCPSRGPITILSHLLLPSELRTVTEPKFKTMKRMCETLVEHGAKLRLLRGQATSYQLLRAIVGSTFNFRGQFFQFVLNSDQDVRRIPDFQWANLLELAASQPAFDLLIIEPLFRRCGSTSQPLLAQTIAAGCDFAFMNELLDSGQDINDFSNGGSPLQAACARLDIDMVTRLLERGAEINAPKEIYIPNPPLTRQERKCRLDIYMTGSARHGMTPLQSACRCEPRTQEMRDRQAHLIKLLVHRGADINARASRTSPSTALQLLCAKRCADPSSARHFRGLVQFLIDNGADVNIPSLCHMYSALQHCAERGDIGQAMMLVQHGADPNAHPHIEYTDDGAWGAAMTALDLAARSGRLDMTQFLLNIGAVSAVPWLTGYSGAEHAATCKDHHAVAEVIVDHHVKEYRKSCQDPQLHSRHQELAQRVSKMAWRRQEEDSRFREDVIKTHPRLV